MNQLDQLEAWLDSHPHVLFLAFATLFFIVMVSTSIKFALDSHRLRKQGDAIRQKLEDSIQ